MQAIVPDTREKEKPEQTWEEFKQHHNLQFRLLSTATSWESFQFVPNRDCLQVGIHIRAVIFPCIFIYIWERGVISFSTLARIN